MERVFREPDYVPKKWLVFSLGLLGGAVFLGMWINSIDSRISANEATIREAGTTSERIIQRLDSIDARLNRIEGRLGVER